jgi:opacity protein-like surface antigen
MFKRIITVSILGISALGMMAANATTPGVYVEGQVGYAHTGKHFVKPFPSSGKVSSKYKGGLAGRLAIGYQFNPNWSVEIGYLQLAQQKAHVKSTIAKQSITLNQHAFDVVGKGILPINNKFDIYAKAGMAYLVNDLKGDVVSGQSIVAPLAKHSWAPEAGVGVTYNMSSNVFIDTAFTHIQPIGKNRPNNINMATIGLGFTFG